MNYAHRQSQLRGRHRLAGLGEINRQDREEMESDAARFARLKDPSSAPRVVSSFNLFQTPEPVAAAMASSFLRYGRTLEPSAGLGRLYRAFRSVSDGQIEMIDVSPDCCRELRLVSQGDESSSVSCRDFLEVSPSETGLFDGVLMNPPFKMGTDVKHIRHAIQFLAPGGRLVALCYNGSRQQQHLQPIADSWEVLPARSFASEGTSADVAMLIVNR